MSDEQEQKKTERLHMLISPAELDAVDDWRFKNRLGTRAEAIRRLIQIGLRTDEAFPRVLKYLDDAYRKVRSAEEITKSLIEDKIDEKLSEYERVGDILSLITASYDIRFDVTDANVAAMHMALQIEPFAHQNQIEKTIEKAEAAKAKSKLYWETSKSFSDVVKEFKSFQEDDK